MSFKGRIWRTKPSSYRKITVLPMVNTQHTTRCRGHCWCWQCLPARLAEERGQLCFPLWQPHPQGCGCQSRFRRDVHQRHCFVCRLRRCKTAAVPVDLSSRVNVLSGTACSTVLSACRFIVPCPKSHISCSSVRPGDPEPPVEWSLARLTPFIQCRHAQERRRFCTAFAVPVASNCVITDVPSRAP